MIIQGMLWRAAAHKAYSRDMLLSVEEAQAALARKWGSECLISVGPGYWIAEKNLGNRVHLVASQTIWTLDAAMKNLGWHARGTPDEWQRVVAMFMPRAR